MSGLETSEEQLCLAVTRFQPSKFTLGQKNTFQDFSQVKTVKVHTGSGRGGVGEGCNNIGGIVEPIIAQ